MTLDIKVFSKSLTIDTHYARNPDAFPVNITGSALNFFITDRGGTNQHTNNLTSTSFYTIPDDSYKSGAINNHSKLIFIENEVANSHEPVKVNYNTDNYFISNILNTNDTLTNFSNTQSLIYTDNTQMSGYAQVTTDYHTDNYFVINERDNTSPVLTSNSNSSTIVYSNNVVSDNYATVAVNYNTDNYFVSGNYETADDNLPTGTRVIVSTLKNLSSDSGDTTASTLDETEIYEFPTLTSLSTTEYTDNITKKIIVTNKELSSTSFTNTSKQIYIAPENGVDSHTHNITSKQITTTSDPTATSYINHTIDLYIAPEHGTSSYTDNIALTQIVSKTQPSIVNYSSANFQIYIDNVQNIDLSTVKQKQIQIVTQTDKGAVSKSKADTTVISMFIKNQADVAYFDSDGYISFKQVTPFNDPIPPSDSTTETGSGGSSGGGGGTTTGPIQSWSS